MLVHGRIVEHRPSSVLVEVQTPEGAVKVWLNRSYVTSKPVIEASSRERYIPRSENDYRWLYQNDPTFRVISDYILNRHEEQIRTGLVKNFIGGVDCSPSNVRAWRDAHEESVEELMDAHREIKQLKDQLDAVRSLNNEVVA